MTSFDVSDARARFLAGLDPERRSTQSWDVDGWTEGWRGPNGALLPGTLGEVGGAWWFRAITDSGRLTGAPADYGADPLAAVSARARIAAFVGEANQVLVHWPVGALAPAAFALREAVGLNEAIAVLADTLPGEALAPFIEWLGPIDGPVAERWLAELSEPAALAAVAAAAPVQVRASWVLGTGRKVTAELLEECLVDVDDETFEAVAAKLLRLRDRQVWDLLIRRPTRGLVPKMLERVDDPIAPWVSRWFAAGDDDVIDELIDCSVGRSKRARTAVAMLGQQDRTTLMLRLADRPEERQKAVLEAIEPPIRELPELPLAEWTPWMQRFSVRVPTPEPEWLDLDLLPDLATRSGHRLPRAVWLGTLAVLQETRLDGRAYELDLHELLVVLDPRSANALWNALFSMWWTNHRPEVQWVIHAAAFLCDGTAIRDLGQKLRRHRKWFGNLSSRVIAALGHSPTSWAVAALDDIARRSRNPSHRELAQDRLVGRAYSEGVTIERFVMSRYPDDPDPLLAQIASERLEHDMAEQVRWAEWLLHRAFAPLPFRRAVSALVLTVADEWGEPTFGILEDVKRIEGDEPVMGGTLRAADGAALRADPDAVYSIAHPAQMADDELARWHEYCAEHEIVQPFAQLERTRFRAVTLSRDGFQSPVGAPIKGPAFLRQALLRGWLPVRWGSHGEVRGVQRHFSHMDVKAELRFVDPLEEDGGGESEIAALAFQTSRGEPLDAHDVAPTAFSEAHLDVTRLMQRES